MTNKEIKMKLAECALNSGVGLEDVRTFYAWVTEEDAEEQNDAPYYDKIPISVVVSYVREKKDVHGSGYGTKLNRRCKENNIKTVGDLVRLGYSGFKKLHMVGIGMMWRVQEVLEELYGIENW